jgi:PAS domain S-box-containing protein
LRGTALSLDLSMATQRITPPTLTDLLFEGARRGLCLVAPDGSVLRANSAWLRITGLSLERVLGAKIIELLPDSRDRWRALLARARAGEHVEISPHGSQNEGRETPWEGSIDPIGMDGGVGLLFTLREAAPRAVTSRTQPETPSRPSETLGLGDASSEARLREINALFNAAIDASPVVVFAQGRDLRYTWIANSVLAYRPEEMVGKTDFDLFERRSDAEGLTALKQRALDTGEPVRDVLPVQHEGAVHWYDVNVRPQRRNGAVVGIIATALDVTDRKRGEDALRESEEHFRVLIQNLHSAVALVDERGAFLVVNQSFRRMFELPTDADILNVNSRDWSQWKVFDEHGDLLPFDEHPVRKAQLTGKAVQNQLVSLKSPSGAEPLWLLVSAVPILDGDGAVHRLICTYYDITARRAAEEALRENEQRLRLFIEHAPAAVAVFDRDMRYLAVSRRYLRDRGLDEGVDLTGRGHYEVFPELPARWKEIHRRCLAGAVESAEEDTFQRRDGGVDWVRWEIHPWTTASGQIGGLLLFNEVITDRKLARDALQESDRRKTEFFALLSHELRNPLAPIRNATFLLDRADPNSEEAAQARGVLRRQTEHLTRLVEDLLDVSRITEGKINLRRVRLDLRDAVSRAAEDYRARLAERGVELRTIVPEAEVWAQADPTRINQVLVNLLHNAFKFTGRGDTVTLTLESVQGFADIRVRDTGAGIELALLSHLFEPFVQGDRTLDRTGGGLGLGLALVKGIVELHGGTVRVASEGVGRGAEFVLRLPLGAPTTPVREDVARGRLSSRGRRVLVVDDNTDAAESLGALLRLHGHTVEIAHDGQGALAKVESAAPDIVFCDIGLPGMSGYEVAQALRARGSRVHLVALTGYAQRSDVDRAKRAGFDSHVAKPPDVEELTRLVDQLV